MEYLFNVLGFVESPQGLNVSLYPLQRTLLKIIFGVPLDYQPQKIDVWDDLRQTKLYTLSEYDYLKMCYEECKCNYGDWRLLPAEGFNEAHLFQGRRSGKSELLAMILAYKIYQVLQWEEPQRIFNLVRYSPIDFSVFNLDESAAARMKDKIASNLERASFFTPYLSVKSTSPSRIGLYSELDRKEAYRWPTLNVGTYSCNATMARGPSSIVAAFDEFAHMPKSSDLYHAAVPATANYRTQDGAADYSLVVSTSSTWFTNGIAFKLHEGAFKNKSIFTHNENTATMNPYNLGEFFRRSHLNNPKIFAAEFGGKFIEHVPGGNNKDLKPITLKEYWEKYGRD